MEIEKKIQGWDRINLCAAIPFEKEEQFSRYDYVDRRLADHHTGSGNIDSGS